MGKSTIGGGGGKKVRLTVFLLPPGWDASPSQGYPPALNSPVPIYTYTWVGRGTVKVKCLAQEHNTMSPAGARTRSARSGVERANHEATAPPWGRGRRELFLDSLVKVTIF